MILTRHKNCFDLIIMGSVKLQHASWK